jgi:hypothetical protein
VWQSGDPTGAVFCQVIDCFTDGVFENLLPDSASQDFVIKIFAYNARSFNAPDGGAAAMDLDGGLCPGIADSGGGEAPAQWTTTCTASAQLNIPVLAVCGPLEPTSSVDSGPAEAAIEGGGYGSGAGPSDASGGGDASGGSDGSGDGGEGG